MTVTELFDGPVIDVRDLFCLYPVPDGTVAALRGLSLAVEAGERLLVHGPNGSGKTTLLRVLTGLQPASAGFVRIAGVDLVGADERTCNALRLKGLGVVDQHSARALRPELSVAANVAMSLQLAGVRRSNSLDTARRTLEELGIGELADRRPGSLSGGEAQRVAVCAAVAHRPAVVLADEPTGELDAVAAEQVYDLLSQASARIGATLVLVTHDAGAVRVADRVVRIRDGRLSEQWSPEAPGDQMLVVDDRGWVRLPENLRAAARADTGVRAELVGGAIRLTGAGSTTGSAEAKSGDARVRRVGDVIARATSIEVRYPGRVVFNGCDLEVPTAALTVIAGRSGAGKSTLLRVLVGLTEPDSGDVALFGEDVRPLDRAGRADLRRRFVAIASQLPALVEALGAEDNLALARTARGLTPEPGLAGKVLDSLGLAALRTRPVRFLSGGERQRVALARCLVVQRPLVVLDEPTSQQDEAHAELVAQALAEAAGQGTAVLCASHDPVLVTSADRVMRLS